MTKKIYCILCDSDKEYKHYTEDVQEIAKLLAKKDTIPKLVCRKCLGYRRRSNNREYKFTYLSLKNKKDTKIS